MRAVELINKKIVTRKKKPKMLWMVCMMKSQMQKMIPK